MIATLIPIAAKLIGSVIKRTLPDKMSEAEKAEVEVKAQAEILKADFSALEQQMKVQMTEMQGNWLQKSWRPIVMLVFTGLIVLHWLGYTAPNLTEVEIVGLLEIVKLGLAGYVVGRSAEKCFKEYKK